MWFLKQIQPGISEDYLIVLEAVKQNGSALEFADEKLRKDKKFILKCIKTARGKLEKIDVSLNNDNDIQKALKSYQNK